LYGYLTGKTRRGLIDRERRGIRETVLLVLENPISSHPDSLGLIKKLIDGNKRVFGVICSPKNLPHLGKALYLDFDISLLELSFLSHFSLARFWADYGHIDGPGCIYIREDQGNTGPEARAFIKFLHKAGFKSYA
jgi:hypothetical protein